MAFAYELIVLLSYLGFVLCMLWVIRDENGFVKRLEQRNAKVDDTTDEEEEESGETEGAEEEEDSGEPEKAEDDTEKTEESEKVEESTNSLEQTETQPGVEGKEEEESSTLRQRHVDIIKTEL